MAGGRKKSWTSEWKERKGGRLGMGRQNEGSEGRDRARGEEKRELDRPYIK